MAAQQARAPHRNVADSRRTRVACITSRHRIERRTKKGLAGCHGHHRRRHGQHHKPRRISGRDHPRGRGDRGRAGQARHLGQGPDGRRGPQPPGEAWPQRHPGPRGQPLEQARRLSVGADPLDDRGRRADLAACARTGPTSPSSRASCSTTRPWASGRTTRPPTRLPPSRRAWRSRRACCAATSGCRSTRPSSCPATWSPSPPARSCRPTSS